MENYGKFTESYKRIQRYPSMSIPPETDSEKSSIGVGTLIKCNSPINIKPHQICVFSTSKNCHKLGLHIIKLVYVPIQSCQKCISSTSLNTDYLLSY